MTKYQSTIGIRLRTLTGRWAMACMVLLTFFNTSAQVGIGTNTPNNTAALHIQDTARGLLIPRLTLQQRNAIPGPAEGLMVYQTGSPGSFWYYSGGQWRNMTAVNNSGSKQTIVLSGSITNTQAQEKITSEYGPNTQIIRIVYCSNLTEVDLSMVTNASEIQIMSNDQLQTVNLSGLVEVTTGFTVSGCPALKSIDLTSLQKFSQGQPVSGFLLASCGLTNLAFTALEEVTGNFVIEGNDSLSSVSFPALKNHFGRFSRIEFKSNYRLATVAFPVLNKVSLLQFYTDSTALQLLAPQLTTAWVISLNGLFSAVALPSLFSVTNGIAISGRIPSVSVPLLKSVSTLDITNDHLITSFSAPSLTTVSSIHLNDNAALTGVSFNSLVNAGNLNFLGNAALSSCSFAALKSVDNFNIKGSAITVLSLPVLSNTQILSLTDNYALATVSLPALRTMGSLEIISNALVNLTVPVLTTAGSLSIHGQTWFDPNNVLSTLSFPALTSLTDPAATTGIFAFHNLTTVNFSNLTSLSNSTFSVADNKLSSAQVNGLLAKLVSIVPPISGRNINLNQFIAAPPTGQGLVDKETLIARPNTVNTNYVMTSFRKFYSFFNR